MSTEYIKDTVIYEKKYTVSDIEEFSEYLDEERRSFTKEQLDELSALLDDAVIETICEFLNSN